LEQINYNEQILRLIELQSLDSKLYRLRKEKDEQPEIIKSLQNKLQQQQQVVKEKEERLKAVQLKRKDKEIELSSQEEQIKKLQSQLYSLKTNKEYTAMLNEINGKKMNQSVLEEDILKIMEEQEEIKRQLDKQKGLFAEEEKKFELEKQKIQNHLKEIEAEIADYEAKRKIVTEGVNPKILAKYEKILKGRNGLAIVEVDPNDLSCKGCYMKTTPQVINEIKMNKGLVFCEVCSRILYVREDTK